MASLLHSVQLILYPFIVYAVSVHVAALVTINKPHPYLGKQLSVQCGKSETLESSYVLPALTIHATCRYMLYSELALLHKGIFVFALITMLCEKLTVVKHPRPCMYIGVALFYLLPTTIQHRENSQLMI